MPIKSENLVHDTQRFFFYFRFSKLCKSVEMPFFSVLFGFIWTIWTIWIFLIDFKFNLCNNLKNFSIFNCWRFQWNLMRLVECLLTFLKQLRFASGKRLFEKCNPMIYDGWWLIEWFGYFWCWMINQEQMKPLNNLFMDFALDFWIIKNN